MVVDNRGVISYTRILKEDLAIYKITPTDGPVPDFKAGQFVTIGLHNPNEGKIVRRAYSIASPPEQKKYFELLVRWVRKPCRDDLQLNYSIDGKEKKQLG